MGKNKTHKMKFKKIVEIPTGVKTTICTNLSGTISVEFKVQPIFDKPALKKWLVSWWEEDNDMATDHNLEVIAPDEINAVNEIYFENPLARKIEAKLIN